MKFKKIAILIGICLLFFLGMPIFSKANNIEISIDQGVFSFNADPGKAYTFKLNVTNGTEEKKEIKIVTQDYGVDDENELEFFDQNNLSAGVSDWIEVDTERIVLSPKEKKEFTFTMAVPIDAEVGSHHGAVLAETISDEKIDNNSESILSGRVGAHVLVNVRGETKGSGKIFNFKHPIIFWKKSLISADFKNTGNIHYIPHGELWIKNLITKREEKIVFDKHFVFPGKAYAFEKEWDNGSIFGIYSVRAAFVDGDGSVNLENGYSFGMLFFPLAVTSFFGLYLIWKKIKQKQLQTTE